MTLRMRRPRPLRSKRSRAGGRRGAVQPRLFYITTARGVAQDHAEAAKWFRLAAEQGLAQAQFNLGVLYYGGEGVEQNRAEAAKWYRLAA